MRNQGYEQTLTRQGVEWTYLPKVNLAEEVNIQKGIQMQARLDQPLIDDLIEQYKDRYQAGEQAPPLVLSQRGKSKYVPLDGNQRLEACKRAKIKVHDAYLVESEDQMVLDRICWSFNNWVNGRRLSYEESLAHATYFVRKYGWTHKAASREFAVHEKAVAKEVRSSVLREKCEEAKIKAPSKDVLINLGAIETLGDDLFLSAAKVCSDIGATTVDAQKLAKDVRSARTSAAKRIAVQEFAASDIAVARRAETKGGTEKARRGGLVRDRLNRVLRETLTILTENPDRASLLMGTKVEQELQRNTVIEVVDLLTLAFGLGSRPTEKIGKLNRQTSKANGRA